MFDKDIYIIRHGETDFNKQGIVQGRGINIEINNTGRQQALRFYRKYQDLNPDAILTSSLIRTHNSVEHFINQGIEWRQFEHLDEISWGIYEGTSGSTERKDHYRTLLDDWRNGNYHSKIPEGESIAELQQRQIVFLDELKKMQFGKVLICSHGRAMRSLICTMLNVELRHMDHFPHQNLGLYVLKQKNGAFELVKKNVTDHLYEA